MGKGAFRGSLHFCGQARQSARTRSKRPFPASRRRGSGDRPPHFPAGRQAEGVPAFIRSPAFGPTDTRIGIRLPSPAAGQTDTRFIRQTRAPGFWQTGTSPPHPDSPTTRTAAGEPPTPAGPTDRDTAAPPRFANNPSRTRTRFTLSDGRESGLWYRVPDMQKIRCAGPRTKARAARKRAETAHTYLYPFAIQILKALTRFGPQA